MKLVIDISHNLFESLIKGYELSKLGESEMRKAIQHGIPLPEHSVALKAQPCEDAVSREAVREGMTKYGFRAPDMSVAEFVEDELPPVTPEQRLCNDCKFFEKESEDKNED